MEILNNDVFGFLKPLIDVHTLGVSTISNLLRDCGYKVFVAADKENEALQHIHKLNNFSLIQRWIQDNNISCLGFSYRLDPIDGSDYFLSLYEHLVSSKMFVEEGGCLRFLFFAGLPEACRIVELKTNKKVIVFPGDETPLESLQKLGIPKDRISKNLVQNNEYDDVRWNFAKNLIYSQKYKLESAKDHSGYSTCGTNKDTIVERLRYAKEHHTLPIIRAHVGPYNVDRLEALKEFNYWVKDLAKSKLLDVLSIGSSQLTQSNFGENWDGLPNGGGVPINSELEYNEIKENAKPMLVRTYSGTKDVPSMAVMHERALNISWHALSFWWFCEIDGRGKNSLLDNLKEHFEAILYIASTGKPLEPNVPHHFAFRGSDDISYIISGYLAIKAAKKLGIKHVILQNMLNTPKYTWGIQDLAKGRALLKLVRELEDETFSVSLQLRAGLDYFSPDEEIAKIQLAAVTALMDDIEPENENSPEIIHVVSYSEAIKLATPPIIKESIQITLSALSEYREMRKKALVPNMAYDKEVEERFYEMYVDAKESIFLLEQNISNLYTPEGFYRVFIEGFLPVPYLMMSRDEFKKSKSYNTALKNGGIRVVDQNGVVINTIDRYKTIIAKMQVI